MMAFFLDRMKAMSASIVYFTFDFLISGIPDRRRLKNQKKNERKITDASLALSDVLIRGKQ